MSEDDNVGALVSAVQEWMESEGRHHAREEDPDIPEHPYCKFDGYEWPCAVARIRAALRKMGASS